MAKSIIQARTGKIERECFLCRLEANLGGYDGELPHIGLHKHHFLHGTADRKKAERYGLWAYMCVSRHHEYGPEAPHVNKEIDLFLQQIAQRRFEEIYGHERFMREFGKNRLPEVEEMR